MSIIIPDPPESWGDIVTNRIMPEALNAIERSTIPFYVVGDVEDGVQRDRTGVLYSVGGEHFVLTASHGLDVTVGKEKGFLYLESPTDGELPIPLSDAIFHGTEETHRDVAVVHIPNEIADRLKANKTFVSHGDCRLKDDSPTSRYALFGYPADWTQQTSVGMACRGFGLLTERFLGQLSRDRFFSPDLHLPVILKDRATPLGGEEPEYLPRMQGISGCGIWRIFDISRPQSITGWSSSQIALVALETRWFKDRDYAQCTWIGAALELISRNYPDCSRAMNLVYRRPW